MLNIDFVKRYRLDVTVNHFQFHFHFIKLPLSLINGISAQGEQMQDMM